MQQIHKQRYKKALFVLILTFQIANVLATNYYVSNTGSNSFNGLSPNAPWQTLVKVTSTSFLPGDSILFKCGDTFKGTLTVKAGSSTAPIVYSAYGTGSLPTITGFQAITSWTDAGNGVFWTQTTIPSTMTLNIVTLDGINTPRGRYPNTNYLKFESHSGYTSITDNEMTDNTDWTGADIVIKTQRWDLERRTITSHIAGTLNFAALKLEPKNSFGYFITNDQRTLDSFGEWFLAKDGKFYMYFGSENPSNHVINVSTIDALSYIDGKNYVVFDRLRFAGANSRAIQLKSATLNGGLIKNCEFEFCGKYGVEALNTSSYITIDNCKFNQINDYAIYCQSPYTTIINSDIQNIGLYPGMGDIYSAVGIFGDYTTIENCTIKNVGYNGIFHRGSYTILKKNYIDTFCAVTDDGGGIYTSKDIYPGKEFSENIIVNGIGNGEGTDDTGARYGNGIYLDEQTTGTTVINNTVANCTNGGIFLHNARDNDIQSNIVYNCKFQMYLQHNDATTPNQSDINILNNIFVAKTLNQYCFSLKTDFNDHLFGSSNNNVFARPIDDNLTFYIKAVGLNLTAKSFEWWKSNTGYDLNSTKSPVSITSTDDILFEFNPGSAPKILSLPYQMIDPKGVYYNDTYEIPAYKSVVLFKSPFAALKTNVLKNEIEVCPNPTKGIFRFVGDNISLERNIDIDIFNLLGEKVYCMKNISIENEFNLSFLSRGVYILKAYSGSKIYLSKSLIIN
jgi:parallel beta-helix repeat protein